MSDNSQANLGSGGDVFRTIDRTTAKTAVSQIDVGGESAELLQGGMLRDGNPLAFSHDPIARAFLERLAIAIEALQSAPPITPTPAGSAMEAGLLYVNGQGCSPQYASITSAASGANTVISGQAGKRIRVLSYVIVASAAVNAKFQSSNLGATVDKSGLMDFAANGGISAPYCEVGHLETNIGDSLGLNLSGATAVGGHITYIVY